MKTLILNGSPRRNGDTASLIHEMRTALHGDIMEVSAYHDGISPCVDCRYCWQHDGCAIQDGMQAVYGLVEAGDNIIIASPLYYSQMTGPLLGLASRFQRYYAARRFRGSPVPMKRKNGVLILVGGGDGSAKPAQEMAEMLFRATNTACIGTVLSLNTDEIPVQQDGAALGRARELALKLNRLHESQCQ